MRSDGRRRGFTLCVAILLASVSTAAGAAAATRTPGSVSWASTRVANATDADTYAGTRTYVDAGTPGSAMILYADGPQAPNGSFDLRLARGPSPGGPFETESIDPADDLVTGYASFATDRWDRPCVSYVSGLFLSDGVLKYARWRHGSWNVQVADPDVAVVDTALTMSLHDRPLIAYTKLDDELRLARHGPSGWTNTPVATGNVVALDIAVDQFNHPHIAFVVQDGTGYVLRYASFDRSTWTIETVGPVSSQGIEFGVELLITPRGNPKIVYPVLDPVQGMAFSHRTSAGWQTKLIAKGNLWQPSTAFDATGALNVVFYDATDGALDYAVRVPGGWSHQTIADSPSPHVRIGRESSIAFDADGDPHVSYYVGREFSGTTLRYAVGTLSARHGITVTSFRQQPPYRWLSAPPATAAP